MKWVSALTHSRIENMCFVLYKDNPQQKPEYNHYLPLSHADAQFSPLLIILIYLFMRY